MVHHLLNSWWPAWQPNFLTHILVHVQASIGWALTVWAIPAKLGPIRIVSCSRNHYPSIFHNFIRKPHPRNPGSVSAFQGISWGLQHYETGEAIYEFTKFSKEPLEIGKILIRHGRPMGMSCDDLTRSRAFVDPTFLCLFSGWSLIPQQTFNPQRWNQMQKEHQDERKKIDVIQAEKALSQKGWKCHLSKSTPLQKENEQKEKVSNNWSCVVIVQKHGKLLSEFDSTCFQNFLSIYLSAWYVSQTYSFHSVTLYSYYIVGASC